MRSTLLLPSSLLLIVGFLAVGVSGRVAASEIVDTIGLAGTDVAHSIGSLPAAESFIATGSSIGAVEVELDRASTANGSVVITIAANSGNAPGSTLDAIYTLPETSIPQGTETLFDFKGLSVNNLSSGTTYWVDVARVGTVSTNIFVTTSTPAAGAGATDYFSGRGAVTAPPAMTICVSGDTACVTANPALPAYTFTGSAPLPPPPPVSEPATVGLIGLGLTALAVARRRAVRRSTVLVRTAAG